MSIIAALAQPAPIASRARRQPAPGGFHIGDDVPDAAVVSGPACVGLHGLLALQEAEADDLQDRTARRHAGSMLAELSVVQRALLKADAAGMAASLARLSGLARHGTVAHDPRLTAVVRARLPCAPRSKRLDIRHNCNRLRPAGDSSPSTSRMNA